MPSTNTQREKLESLVSQLGKYSDRIKKLYDLSKKITSANKDIFMVQYDRIEDYYTSYDEITDEVIALCAAMDEGDYVDTAPGLAEFEEMYFHIKAFARQHNWHVHVVAPEPSHRNEPRSQHPVLIQPRLPKLEIPQFSGDLRDWSNFFSLFKSTINRRNDISEVEKFQYLRSFFKGPPLTLIENLQIAEGSYDIAYQLLGDRYDNKRTLAAHYLNFKQLSNDNV